MLLFTIICKHSTKKLLTVVAIALVFSVNNTEAKNFFKEVAGLAVTLCGFDLKVDSIAGGIFETRTYCNSSTGAVIGSRTVFKALY